MTIPTTTAFDRARASADARPLVLLYLFSDLGLRVFSFGPPPPVASVAPARHDGTFWHDGAIRYGQGAAEAIEVAERLVDLGDLTEALGPVEGDLLASLEALERGALTVALDNADRYFSGLLEDEDFVGRGAQVVVGFEGLEAADWMTAFAGRVDRLRLTDAVLELALAPADTAAVGLAAEVPQAPEVFTEGFESIYALGPAPAATGESLVQGFETGDEFDDRDLDLALWTVEDALHGDVAYGTDRGWVWEGTGEALVIKAAQGPYDFGIDPSTANDGTVFTGPFVYREVSGDFEVATEIDVVGITINQEAGGFLCVGPTAQRNWFGLFRANFFGTRYLNLRIVIDDAVIVNAPGVVAGTKLWVKFARAADTYSVFYNTEAPADDDDYTLWTSFTTDKLGPTVRLGYGVGAPSYGGTHTLRADWIRQISGAGDISDDFDDADWETDWTLQNPGPAKVFEETEDRLYVTTNDQPSNFFDAAFSGPRVRYAGPEGDFDVYTRVRGEFLTANVEGVHFIAAMKDATADWFGVRLAYVASLGGRAFLAESTVAGATAVHATAATTATEATLRIERTGDLFTAYYRLLETDPWTTLASATVASVGAQADFVLGVSSGGAINYDAFGEFDYLRGRVTDPIRDPARWKTILYDAGVGGAIPAVWSQNDDPAYCVGGFASGAYQTGTRDDSFVALVARGAPFDVARSNAVLSAWFRPGASTDAHYWGLVARLQPASAGDGPGDVTATDLRTESAYFLVVDRLHRAAIHRGPLDSTLWTKRWPDGAVWIDPDPALAPLQGGYRWRLRVTTEAGGAPGFEIAQTNDPDATVDDAGAWSVLATWHDTDAAGRIEAPGFFGAFALTGAGNDKTAYVDALELRALDA